jgi:serine/threonine protein kinase
MPKGLTIDNDSTKNIENNKINEVRMIKEQYIDHTFKDSYNIRSTSDIINLLLLSQNKQYLGKGTRSEGYIITFPDNNQYIVRETEVDSHHIRNTLSHEIKIYKHIQKNIESQKYVSCLLYADIPLVYHKNSQLNKAYFIFKYIPGTTLDNFISTYSEFVQFDTIIEWVISLIKGIDFLDSINIIHRDIKPQNIYIDYTNNKLLLFDLETACIKGKDCLAYEFRGTREYAPPKSLVLINQKDFSNLKSYQHTKFSDYYSVIKILQKDLSKIVIPTQKDKLLNYAELMETELLKQNGGKRSGGKINKGLKKTHKKKLKTRKLKSHKNKV